ncbi:MAG TPA: hypothetical protein VKV26_02780 [Dehalococcoidia bacterium]|nr:hypothetical protein [Dehalococcoidia bacterium]
MEPHGPLTRLSSEIDWQYRRAVVQPRSARDAALLRERELSAAVGGQRAPRRARFWSRDFSARFLRLAWRARGLRASG